MIPKLNETSSKISKNLNMMTGKTETVNGKRDFNNIENHEDDRDDIIEIKPASDGYKKVKQNGENTVKPNDPDLILVGNAFTVKLLCHEEIQNFLAPEKQCRYAGWPSEGNESVMVLKREDFLFLPTQVTLRLSKEHAKVTATKKDNTIIYEIIDLSVNGTYYLGNKRDGGLKQVPLRLQKGIPFKLREGDWICLLLKKDAKTNEVLLGFEFQLEENQ